MREHRETANADMDPAIPCLAGAITAGRAEATILVHKNLHEVQIFVNKIKTYHAAAGESGFHQVKCPI